MSSFLASHYNDHEAETTLHSDVELPLMSARANHDRKSANVTDFESMDNSEENVESQTRKLDHHPLPRSTFKIKFLHRFGIFRLWKYVRTYLKSDDEDGKTQSARGWRTAVIAATFGAAFVLLINMTFVIVALIRFKIDAGIGTIHTGNCELVKRWDTAIHLLINVLGTLLLAASSFTMQCITSPTRTEVDHAHTRRKALDIGITSFKNLFYMRCSKAILWVALFLTTVPLHLLWNSTIFSSTTINLFSYVVATEDFLTGAVYTTPDPSYQKGCLSTDFTPVGTPEMILKGYQAGNYTRLSPGDCRSAYTVPLTDRQNLIIITKPTIDMNMGDCAFGRQTWNGSSVLALQTNLLSGPDSHYDWTSPPLSSSHSNGIWSIGSGGASRYAVEYCLSETVDVSHCRLQFVPEILYIVTVCNMVKVICMSIVAYYLWDLNEPILATVGDATASFLDCPDRTTLGWCLLDLQALNLWRAGQPPPSKITTYTRPKTTKLYHATSKKRWWLTTTPLAFYLLVGYVFFSLCFAIKSADVITHKVLGIAQSSIVIAVHASTDKETSRNLFIDILVANLSQLALSTTYFLYNSLYTAQCAALEWSKYILNPKSLRVTYPHGQQRSTYYLHLPYRYAIPLTTVLMVMHFLISESISLARLDYYKSDGTLSDQSFSGIELSSSAIITACSIGLAMIVAQVMNSRRKLDNQIPIHGNSSAVISALCHTEKLSEGSSSQCQLPAEANPKGSNHKLSEKCLTWGVTKQPEHTFGLRGEGSVDNTDAAGHCAFSDRPLELPQTGSVYR